MTAPMPAPTITPVLLGLELEPACPEGDDVADGDNDKARVRDGLVDADVVVEEVGDNIEL